MRVVDQTEAAAVTGSILGRPAIIFGKPRRIDERSLASYNARKRFPIDQGRGGRNDH